MRKQPPVRRISASAPVCFGSSSRLTSAVITPGTRSSIESGYPVMGSSLAVGTFDQLTIQSGGNWASGRPLVTIRSR